MNRYRISTTGNVIVADEGFMLNNFSADDYVLEASVQEDSPPSPRYLSRLEFEEHVQSVSGLNDADFFAMLQDTALALTWHRLGIASRIERDSNVTQNSLANMVASGRITESQAESIKDTWPIQS